MDVQLHSTEVLCLWRPVRPADSGSASNVTRMLHPFVGCCCDVGHSYPRNPSHIFNENAHISQKMRNIRKLECLN